MPNFYLSQLMFHLEFQTLFGLIFFFLKIQVTRSVPKNQPTPVCANTKKGSQKDSKKEKKEAKPAAKNNSVVPSKPLTSDTDQVRTFWN